MPEEWARLVLIDDQVLPRNDRWKLGQLAAFACRHLDVDYIAWETQLRRYTNEWLAMQDNRAYLTSEVGRNNGIPQCSHYIAIWYLMRLGHIATHGIFQPVSRRALTGETAPTGNRVVSILAASIESAENASQVGILDHNIHRPAVTRIYYGDYHDISR